MSKSIATCPSCGHQFIVKSKSSGATGAVIGAIIGAPISIGLGPIGIGGALAGAVIGGLISGKGPSCTCPNCGATVDRPKG